MKTNLVRLAVLLALAAPAVACSAPPEETRETTESALATGTWQKLLTCNGGAAVLDVDPGERRNVQLVIGDPSAVAHLQSQSPTPIKNGRGEIVIRAAEPLKHGLFAPSDFGADDFWRYHVQDFFPYAGVVKREGRGIKVILAKRFEPICEGGQWGPQGGCWGGHTIRARVLEEAANWYFDDCR